MVTGSHVLYIEISMDHSRILNQILRVTDVHATGEGLILFLDILLYIRVNIPVNDNNSIQNDPGRKSKGKKKKTEKSQAQATLDEPQASDISEEPEISRKPARKCHHPLARPRPRPPKENKKRDQRWPIFPVSRSSAGCILSVHGGEPSPLVQ